MSAHNILCRASEVNSSCTFVIFLWARFEHAGVFVCVPESGRKTGDLNSISVWAGNRSASCARARLVRVHVPHEIELVMRFTHCYSPIHLCCLYMCCIDVTTNYICSQFVRRVPNQCVYSHINNDPNNKLSRAMRMQLEVHSMRFRFFSLLIFRTHIHSAVATAKFYLWFLSCLPTLQ